MSLFKNIFESEQSSEAQKKINWIPLTSADQLDTIIVESNTQTVAIFKHSTRCGISRSVKKQFEKGFKLQNAGIKMYYLDLLNYRDISAAIASKFKVQHESPQLLVIKSGVVVANDSHYGILQDIDLKEFL